nr:zinc finger, CCHC-type [Tanacetum cinerariifolium]
MVQQPEPKLKKSKKKTTSKNFGLEFQLYLIEGTRDKVSNQHSYCFNVEDDSKTFNEAMKSHDIAFWKEAINDEMDFIVSNNTWVFFGPDIAFVVAKLSRYTSNPIIHHSQAIQGVLKYLKKTIDYSLTYIGYLSVLERYTDASWISNTEDNPSSSGWVFRLGGGAISWASKKQTCITSSIMEYKFVALAAADKEAKWLRNLILEIPLWSKPIALISIRCDSATTLANRLIAKCTMGSLDT